MEGSWNIIGPITTRGKVPKTNTNNMSQQFGKQHCKDICDRFSSGRPIGKAYLTHHYCSICAKWLTHDVCPIVKLTPRCPCCKKRVRTKTIKTYNTVVEMG
jgi:hypothetical protein